MRAGGAQGLVGIGLAAALGLAAAGCGGTTKTPTASSTTTTAVAPTTAQTKAAITTTWTSFFDYSTPEATRLSLLQNGSKYATVISSLSHLLPAGAAATVQAVKIGSPTSATVTYSLKDAHGTLESGLTGAAIEVGGKWLVGDSTFCGLVALAGSTCPK